MIDRPTSAPALSRGPSNMGRKCGPTNPFIEFKKEDVEQSIPDRFEQQVGKYPRQTAVKSSRHELTYEALNQAANRLAQAILRERGEGEEPVAFLLEHGAPQIIALLGILKAGKIYVPLDPSFPQARLAAMLEDSQAGVIVTDNANLALATQLTCRGRRFINLDATDPGLADGNPRLSLSPDRPASILYTSGSTGRPKGVVQNHRNLLHYTLAYTNSLHISADDRLSLLTSCSYAASVVDIFPALLNGAMLLPLALKTQGLHSLARWLREEEVTVSLSVPSVFRQWVATLTGTETFPRLRLIRLGGEAISRKDVELYQERFEAHTLLVSGLGTSEILTISVCFLDKETQLGDRRVPVGYAMEGAEILLLDDAGRDVGPEQVGEIVVRSPYLAPGYWHDPESTRASFLDDPEDKGVRIYHTGDLGLMRPDGCLEHLGRKDFQVKVRGQRVEVEEIEATLLDLGIFKEAVVAGREAQSGDQRLVAYLVPKGRQVPSMSELRATLREKLPDSMIPSAFVLLDALPLTPTGKVDRRALPAPETSRPVLDQNYDIPRDSLDQLLIGVWEACLNVRPVGIRDNFFELGGDSLTASAMLAQVESLCGTKVSPNLLLSGATVENLADAIMEHVKDRAQTSPVEVQGGDAARRFFFLHGDFSGGGLYCVQLARHLGKDQPFYALPPHGLNGSPVPRTIEEMAADHLRALLAFQPDGPYLLGGHCNGALIAFEMARRLRLEGRQVDLLALVAPPFAEVEPPAVLRFVDELLRVNADDCAPPPDLDRLGEESRHAALMGVYDKACSKYLLRPYPGRVTLLLPLEHVTADRLQGNWKTVAQEMDIHVIPGGHLTILNKHLQGLADCLKGCLRRARPVP